MADVPENAPEHCPGTESDNAGKSSACAGCPNQEMCASSKPKGPDPDMDKIEERMAPIKHKILVMSGKGGVGKSTFTSQLAFGLARDQTVEVGVMDVDICGPSIPVVMGVAGEHVHRSLSGWSPVYVDSNLAVMSIGLILPNQDEAVIWRGPKKNGLIKQFLKDVEWGQLDFLVIDTPPGTSDEHLSLATCLASSNITGAVIITTPQEMSLLDVRKEINFCKKVNIPVIGVVENMSAFVCPKCKTTSIIFPPTTGGAEQMAAEMQVPFLGRLPLDPRIGRSCDEGKSFVEAFPESPAAVAYLEIIAKIRHYAEAASGSQ